MQPDTIFVSGGPGGVLKFQPGETLAAALADLPLADRAPASADDSTARTADELVPLQTSRIDLRRVGVVRDDKSLGTFDASALSSNGESGPTLQPGDTIVLVDKPLAVHVNGDVQSPGVAYLWNDEPLSDALAQVGGPTPSAATSHIALTRGGVTQFVALGDPVFESPAVGNDAITVPAAPRVVVAGLVANPGAVTLKTNFTLLSALYEAGGPTKWADLSQVQVVSNNTKTTYDVNKLVHGASSQQNPELNDGDMVFVPEGHKIDTGGIFQGLLSALLIVK
jgi:protein involved in polysaccharide export with SLBB domain